MRLKYTFRSFLILIILTMSCNTKTVYRPEPFPISIPGTKQEIIDAESRLTKTEAIMAGQDKFFFTTWKNDKTWERVLYHL